ncbi:RhoGAP domain-containing protein/PBD domain-containing protein [Cephalotus follicularis]|uniref:RhoGAP domain-containing protein/PBD domain-containing protein n=1 Tax=Cephalotus follicularis TaxID=3775 RepID=A0A1Q3D6U5_CEPFO|nr:RhoGAP domain-containing protein/PBD domain-containing protein [Cephalotus follicularis]
MTRLFRSKSCGHVGLTEFNTPLHPHESEEDEDDEDDDITNNPLSTPFISPRFGGGWSGQGRNGNYTSTNNNNSGNSNNNQSAILDRLGAALRKSLITCSVEREDVASPSMDISWPTDVRHVSHVTFDRFNGFLGLPTEFEPEVPRRVPSASASAFGVSAKSMQCSYDEQGNSVPTILLMMQKRLYAEGGLRAEGIFRINAENSQEEFVRDQLNKGVVPRGIDVHCLAGLIKAWLRELPAGVLDCLTPEQVMHCNTEDDCSQLEKLLPPTEAALLDWSINLMVDVVEHERYNKMKARNIAMVFAPNMTQMADPLTALIHAVQVMNFLKTLILKTLRERGVAAKARLLSSCSDSPSNKYYFNPSNINMGASCEQSPEALEGSAISKLLRTAKLGKHEFGTEEKFWSFERNSDKEKEIDSISGSRTPSNCEMGTLENGCRGRYDDGDWLSLRKGVRRLCRHPIFQLIKPEEDSKPWN